MMTDPVGWPLDSSIRILDRTVLDQIAPAGGSKTSSSPDADAKLKNATDQFEALLLNQMIREMRATVPESALFPHSMEKEIYTAMLDEKIAEQMTKRGGIGLSRMLFDQLKAK